jgi:hypothetical protein
MLIPAKGWKSKVRHRAFDAHFTHNMDSELTICPKIPRASRVGREANRVSSSVRASIQPPSMANVDPDPNAPGRPLALDMIMKFKLWQMNLPEKWWLESPIKCRFIPIRYLVQARSSECCKLSPFPPVTALIASLILCINICFTCHSDPPFMFPIDTPKLNSERRHQRDRFQVPLEGSF